MPGGGIHPVRRGAMFQDVSQRPFYGTASQTGWPLGLWSQWVEVGEALLSIITNDPLWDLCFPFSSHNFWV